MNNEPNKPIEARELTDKELEGVVGGIKPPLVIAMPDELLAVHALPTEQLVARAQLATAHG